MINSATIIRIVAILVVFYSFYGIWGIYKFSESLDNLENSTTTLFEYALNPNNYQSENFQLTHLSNTENYVDESFNFWKGLLDLRKSLLALILAIIAGLYFIFDPLTSHLRDFIKYSLKI